MIQTLTLNLGYLAGIDPQRVLASAVRLIGRPTSTACWERPRRNPVLVLEYQIGAVTGGAKDLMWRLAELAFEIDQIIIRMFAVGEHGAWLASVHSPGFYGDQDMRARTGCRLRPGYIKPGKPKEFTLPDGGPLSKTDWANMPLWPAGLHRAGAQIEFDDGRPGATFADLLPQTAAPSDRQSGRGFTYADT